MLSNLPKYLANARKAIINMIGLAGALLSLGLLPNQYAAWVTTGIAVLTVIVHYITPNADAPGTTTAADSPDATDDTSVDSSAGNTPAIDPPTFVEQPQDESAYVPPAAPVEIADPSNPATPLTPAVPPSS